MAEQEHPCAFDEIADVLAEARVMREALLRPPADGSLANYELTVKPEPSVAAVMRLFTSANLWTAIPADQLFGVSLLVRSGQTVFSFFPILRSIFEHGLAVAWVLDDDADQQARTARAALAALDSQRRLARAASGMAGEGSATHREAEALFVQLQAEVEADFGPISLRPLQLAGETLPRPTGLIKRFGERWGNEREGAGMYGYLCGTGNHPSLSAFEYFDVKNPTAGANMPPHVLNPLLQAALVPFLKSLDYVCAYMGWPTELLNAYSERVDLVIPRPGKPP